MILLKDWRRSMDSMSHMLIPAFDPILKMGDIFSLTFMEGPLQTGLHGSSPRKNFKSQTLFWTVLDIQTSWILLNAVNHYTTSHLKKWNLTLPNPKIIRGAQCAPPPTVGLHGFYNRGWHQVCEVHKGDGRKPNGDEGHNNEMTNGGLLHDCELNQQQFKDERKPNS